LFYHLVLLFEV
jgi:hypothetical protein